MCVWYVLVPCSDNKAKLFYADGKHFILGFLFVCPSFPVTEAWLAICYSKNSYSTQCQIEGAQWLSGRVLDSRPKGQGFEPHRRHCIVVLEQDTFSLA